MKTGIYIISSAIAWAAMCIWIALTLKGSGYFDRIIPILGSGAVWFLIICPAAFKNK